MGGVQNWRIISPVNLHMFFIKEGKEYKVTNREPNRSVIPLFEFYEVEMARTFTHFLAFCRWLSHLLHSRLLTLINIRFFAELGTQT